MTREINIQEKYEYEYETIELFYKGENIHELNTEKHLHNLINNYFNSLSLERDHLKIITNLKKILNNYKEKN